MTLIIGTNLSDRLYLAADSRVTGPGGLQDDAVLKLTTLRGPREVSYIDGRVLAMAVAGRVDFCSFIYRKIKLGIERGLISTDIRLFGDQILDYLRPYIDEWLRDGGDNSGGYLIIGGICSDRRKRIETKKMMELVQLHQESALPFDRLKQIMKDEVTNPTVRELSERMLRTTGMSLSATVARNSKPYAPDYYVEALRAGTLPEIPSQSDSLIIGIEINPKRCIHRKIEAEWGSFIAAGSGGIHSGDLPETFLTTQEFGPFRGNTQPHLIESAITADTIRDIASNRGLSGKIGGTILLYALQGSCVIACGNGRETYYNGTDIFLKQPSGLVKMIPFYEWGSGNPSAGAEL